MKQYRITLEGKTFDVEILDDPRQQQVRVRVNNKVLTVDVQDSAAVDTSALPAAPVPSPTLETAAVQSNTVTAPLPGVIKSIVVQSGQIIVAGDELLVIEAMKMDNVIRAQRDGAINAIRVAQGQQVAHGDPLLSFTD